MKKGLMILLAVQLLLLSFINLKANALPNPKNGQWAANSNLKSRDSKEKEKSNKR